MEDHLNNKNRLDSEWAALCAYEAEPCAVTVARKVSRAWAIRSGLVLSLKWSNFPMSLKFFSTIFKRFSRGIFLPSMAHIFQRSQTFYYRERRFCNVTGIRSYRLWPIDFFFQTINNINSSATIRKPWQRFVTIFEFRKIVRLIVRYFFFLIPPENFPCHQYPIFFFLSRVGLPDEYINSFVSHHPSPEWKRKEGPIENWRSDHVGN